VSLAFATVDTDHKLFVYGCCQSCLIFIYLSNIAML